MFLLNLKISPISKKIKEITGSKFVFGEIIYCHIENSLHQNSKNIYNNSIFPIWSMSKPINSCNDDLKEKGLINFNDKVSKYIPAFENIKCKDDKGEYIK